MANPTQQDELCLVCGDRASGFHYGQLSCEGCKGFFRRSVTKSTRHQCKYGDDCEIDMYMRRKCPACRFKKCEAIGMRKECVVPEVQCAIKRESKRAQKDKDKPNSTTRDCNSNGNGHLPTPLQPSSQQFDLHNDINQHQANNNTNHHHQVHHDVVTQGQQQIAQHQQHPIQLQAPHQQQPLQLQPSHQNHSHLNSNGHQHLHQAAPPTPQQTATQLPNNHVGIQSISNTHHQAHHLSSHQHLHPIAPTHQQTATQLPTNHVGIQPTINNTHHSTHLLSSHPSHINGTGMGGSGATTNGISPVIHTEPSLAPVNRLAVLHQNHANSLSPSLSSHNHMAATRLHILNNNLLQNQNLTSKQWHKTLAEEILHERREIINDLLRYQEEFESPKEEDIKNVPPYHEGQGESQLRHFTEMTILTVKLIVEFAKKVYGFESLTREDQITLLKASASEIMMLRSTRKYDIKTDSILFANNQPFTRENYRKAHIGEIADAMFNFCRSTVILRLDPAEYALITALIIFSERPNLREPEKVQKIQEFYLELVQAYVESYEQSENCKFARLLSLLPELRALGIVNSDVCFSLKVKNHRLPEFLAEIWDVNQEKQENDD